MTGLVILAVLALVAEVVELLAGWLGVRKARPGPYTGWAALLGGFAGMILLTPLIPIPIVGTIAGGLLGCFGAAVVVEYRHHGDITRGSRVGWAAVIGRLYGLLVKLLTALLMAGLVVVMAC